ncbi:MAG: GNAT family N-acetyltransferase [Candidatus Thorarchaeota archaeon]
MIKGEKIGLRAIEREDLIQLRNWRNRPELRLNFREYRELSMKDQENFYETMVQGSNHVVFGIVISKQENEPLKPYSDYSIDHLKLIGVCRLSYINWHDRNAETGIYIGDESELGKGYASDALKTLVRYGFCELGLQRIWAEIYTFNEESLSLFLRCGFKEEGILRKAHFTQGRFWDSKILAILAEDFFEQLNQCGNGISPKPP